jgi:hypothetical protein
MNKGRINDYLLIIARITGTAVAAFLLFMLAGHLLNGEDAKAIFGLRGKELLVFIVFPISFLIGYLITFWKRRAGSIIVIASQLSLYLFRPDLFMSGFEVLTIPAILYIIQKKIGK